MTTKSIAQGYVVSDLHIFSRASLYEQFLPQLFNAARNHTHLVLNGDTFDFKRSHFRTAQETIDHAIELLRNLCAHSPQTAFFYLLGNHDCNPRFVAALNEHIKSIPNLQLVADSLTLGPNLFLHGDVCDLPPNCYDLSHVRARYASAEPSSLSILLANIITHLRLNIVEYVRHSKIALAKKIIAYLQQTQPHFRETTKTIFFGHTHVPFAGFEYQGLRFHNTGSLIRGLRITPMEFSFKEHQLTGDTRHGK